MVDAGDGRRTGSSGVIAWTSSIALSTALTRGLSARLARVQQCVEGGATLCCEFELADGIAVDEAVDNHPCDRRLVDDLLPLGAAGEAESKMRSRTLRSAAMFEAPSVAAMPSLTAHTSACARGRPCSSRA
jgi:hypothetical protein